MFLSLYLDGAKEAPSMGGTMGQQNISNTMSGARLCYFEFCLPFKIKQYNQFGVEQNV